MISWESICGTSKRGEARNGGSHEGGSGALLQIGEIEIAGHVQ